MFFDKEEAAQHKGKRTTGFASFPSLIQPARKDNSVWAGTSAIKWILTRSRNRKIRIWPPKWLKIGLQSPLQTCPLKINVPPFLYRPPIDWGKSWYHIRRAPWKDGYVGTVVKQTSNNEFQTHQSASFFFQGNNFWWRRREICACSSKIFEAQWRDILIWGL